MKILKRLLLTVNLINIIISAPTKEEIQTKIAKLTQEKQNLITNQETNDQKWEKTC